MHNAQQLTVNLLQSSVCSHNRKLTKKTARTAKQKQRKIQK